MSRSFEKSRVKLGRGGCANVWLGRCSDTHELVAIKRNFCRPHGSRVEEGAADGNEVPHDEEEHCIMQRVCPHSNMVNILGYVDDGLYTNFALELMTSDLHAEIANGNFMSEEEVKVIVREVLKGVAHLHECNVVHRDLKPSNVLLKQDTSISCGIRVALSDFGVAHYAT